jgi:hypothetical protein
MVMVSMKRWGQRIGLIGLIGSCDNKTKLYISSSKAINFGLPKSVTFVPPPTVFNDHQNIAYYIDQSPIFKLREMGAAAEVSIKSLKNKF